MLTYFKIKKISSSLINSCVILLLKVILCTCLNSLNALKPTAPAQHIRHHIHVHATSKASFTKQPNHSDAETMLFLLDFKTKKFTIECSELYAHMLC